MKKNILFIHGFSNSPKVWNPTIQEFKEEYTCYTLDLNKLSTEILQKQNKISTEDLADALYQFCINNKISKFHLVGHSMGGYVSAAFANKFPEFLLSFSLVHSVISEEDSSKLKIRNKSIRLLEKGEVERQAFLKAMVHNMFLKDFRQKHSALINNYISLAYAIPGELIIEQYKAILHRKDYINLVNLLPFPIHWILGAEDKVIPPQLAFKEVLNAPKSYISYYKNVGHMVMDENFSSFIFDLKKYFKHIEEYYID